jgi:hypothetical protein
LSGVSVAVPAAILKSLLGAGGKLGAPDSTSLKSELWSNGWYFILTGFVFCVLAAYYSYKQRAWLAYYYGRISKTEALGVEPSADTDLRNRIEEADRWDNWWPYYWGLTTLVFGFAEYVLAFCSTKLTNYCILRVLAYALPVLAVICATLQRYVLVHYKEEHAPWKEFRKHITGFLVKLSSEK